MRCPPRSDVVTPEIHGAHVRVFGDLGQQSRARVGIPGSSGRPTLAGEVVHQVGGLRRQTRLCGDNRRANGPYRVPLRPARRSSGKGSALIRVRLIDLDGAADPL
jgi:hypothetical protein